MKKQIITLTVVMFTCAVVANAHVTVRARGGRPSHRRVEMLRKGCGHLENGSRSARWARLERAVKARVPLYVVQERAAAAAQEKYGAKRPTYKIQYRAGRPARVVERVVDANNGVRHVWSNGAAGGWERVEPGMPTTEVNIRDIGEERAVVESLPAHTLRPFTQIIVPDGNGGFVTRTYLTPDVNVTLPELPIQAPVMYP